MKTFYLTFLMMIFACSIAFGQVTKSSDVKKPSSTSNQNFIPGNFVDKDNNGVCDNYEKRENTRQGKNFVDADGDGVCDRRAGNGYGQGKRGKNYSQGCRRGGNAPNRCGRCK